MPRRTPPDKPSVFPWHDDPPKRRPPKKAWQKPEWKKLPYDPNDERQTNMAALWSPPSTTGGRYGR
jgi:hypothetical protein